MDQLPVPFDLRINRPKRDRWSIMILSVLDASIVPEDMARSRMMTITSPYTERSTVTICSTTSTTLPEVATTTATLVFLSDSDSIAWRNRCSRPRTIGLMIVTTSALKILPMSSRPLVDYTSSPRNKMPRPRTPQSAPEAIAGESIARPAPIRTPRRQQHSVSLCVSGSTKQAHQVLHTAAGIIGSVHIQHDPVERLPVAGQKRFL